VIGVTGMVIHRCVSILSYSAEASREESAPDAADALTQVTRGQGRNYDLLPDGSSAVGPNEAYR
jgi:hypothetical protein